MNTKKLATWVMLAAAAVLIGFDIVIAVNATQGDTFSEIIREASSRFVALPWAIGGIMGHWFWTGKSFGWWKWPTVFTVVVVLEGLNLFLGLGHPLAAFVIGIGCGRLAWSSEGPGAK